MSIKQSSSMRNITLLMVLPTIPDAIYHKWYLKELDGLPLTLSCIRTLQSVLKATLIRVARATRFDESILNSGRVDGMLEFITLPPGGLLAGVESVCPESGHCIVVTPKSLLTPQDSLTHLAEQLDEGTDFCTISGMPDEIAPVAISARLARCLIEIGASNDDIKGVSAWAEWLQGLLKNDAVHDFAQTTMGVPPVVSKSISATGRAFGEMIHPIDTPFGLRALESCFELPDSVPCDLLDRYSERISVLLESRRPPLRAQLDDAPSVLFVSAQSAYSGAEESAALLCGGLVKSGTPVTAVIGLDGFFADRMRDEGVTVIIAERDFSIALADNVEYLGSLLSATRATIIHMNGPIHPAAYIAARMRGVRIVSHMRVFGTGRNATLAQDCDCMVTVSNAVKEDMLQMGLPERKLRCVYNGIDCDAWAAEPGRSSVPGRIIMVANVGPGKRQDFLLRAMPAVLNAHKHAAVHFCGEIVDWSYYERLKRMSAEPPLKGRVHFEGFVTNMRGHYHLAEVSVLCSEREPLARSLLEAQAAGTAVVGADTGGTSEIIRDGVNGQLFSTEEQLASKLIHLLGDTQTRSRFVEAGLDNVRTRFSLSSYISGVLGVYREVLQ